MLICCFVIRVFCAQCVVDLLQVFSVVYIVC